MATSQAFEVMGYELASDRLYDPETHMWVQPRGGDRVRVGYDPLGAETAGDIVALSLAAPGSAVLRGEPLGWIEAAKFVGPLPSPISGRVLAANDDVLAAPGSLNADPLGSWLVELAPAEPAELALMLEGEAAVGPWFAHALQRFRAQGAIAE